MKRITSDKNGWTLEIENIGSWHSKGTVYGDNEEPLHTVERNFHSFPFLFIEDHPSGDDFLVCGEDYQGQTVINLSTGERKSFLPEEAAEGCGFCWIWYYFDPTTSILVVEGCYWACPYEVRFYDFSDPMKGWANLYEGEWIDAYANEPGTRPVLSVENGVTVATVPQCRYADNDRVEAGLDVDEDEDSPDYIVVGSKVLEMRDGFFVLTHEEYTPEENVRRAKREAAQKRWDAHWKNYKSTDEVYLKAKVLVPSLFPNAPTYFTHKGPLDSIQMTRTLQNTSSEDKLFPGAEVTWNQTSGPIILTIKREDNLMTHEYENSACGMEMAITEARNLV